MRITVSNNGINYAFMYINYVSCDGGKHSETNCTEISLRVRKSSEIYADLYDENWLRKGRPHNEISMQGTSLLQ
jgi:hypothetical protein